MNLTAEIGKNIAEWLKRAQKIVDENAEQHGYLKDVLKIRVGRKYIKILRGDGSVFCFLDENGNVLKAASWATPAQGVRGNIFEKGKEGVSAYGALYKN